MLSLKDFKLLKFQKISESKLRCIVGGRDEPTQDGDCDDFKDSCGKTTYSDGTYNPSDD